MEQTTNITRSALYEEIYSIVKRLDIRPSKCDDLDVPSASYLLEQLFKKWQQASVMQAEASASAEGAAVGQRSVDKTVSAVCAKCAGTGILKGGPTDGRKDEPCPCVAPARRF